MCRSSPGSCPKQMVEFGSFQPTVRQRHPNFRRGWPCSSIFHCSVPRCECKTFVLIRTEPSFSHCKLFVCSTNKWPALGYLATSTQALDQSQWRNRLKFSHLMTHAVLRSSQCHGSRRRSLSLLLPRESTCESKPKQSGGTIVLYA